MGQQYTKLSRPDARSWKLQITGYAVLCFIFTSQSTRGDGLDDVREAIVKRREQAKAWCVQSTRVDPLPGLKLNDIQDGLLTRESVVVDLTQQAFRWDVRPDVPENVGVGPFPIECSTSFDGKTAVSWYPRKAEHEDPNRRRVALRKMHVKERRLQSITQDPLLQWLGFFSADDFFDHPQNVLEGYKLVNESPTQVVLEKTVGKQPTQYFFSKSLDLNLVKLVDFVLDGERMQAKVIQTVEYQLDGEQSFPHKVSRRVLGTNVVRIKQVQTWKPREPLTPVELSPPEGFLRHGMLISDATVPGKRPRILDAITGEAIPIKTGKQ